MRRFRGKVYVLFGFFVVLLLIFLMGRAAPIDIVKPFDVSRTGQVASMSFKVDKARQYRFALYFVIGKNDSKPRSRAEMDSDDALWGGLNKKGVKVPIRVKVLKGDEIFFEGDFLTEGVYWFQSFEYEKRKIDAAIRLIGYLKFVPGDYTLEAAVIDGVREFRDVESYVRLSCYDPKI